MSFEFKLMILGIVVLGDLAAVALIAPRLIRHGKSMTAVVLAGAVAVSAVFLGVVLFLLL